MTTTNSSASEGIRRREEQCQKLEVGVKGGCGVVVKEVSATVVGLLVGGHVGLATSLFGGANSSGAEAEGSNTRYTLPQLWDGRHIVGRQAACRTESGVAGLRENVIEYARTSCGNSSCVRSVCCAGGVDAVMWMVSVLGLDSDEVLWVMYDPMSWCMYDGKIEVVKWLFDRFGFEWELGEAEFFGLYNIWCQQFTTELALVTNKHSTVKDCQIFEHVLSPNFWALPDLYNIDVAKWLLTTFPSSLDEVDLNHVCRNTGDVEFTQWLVTEQSFTPTAATFASACSTSRKRGSTLAKWLSTKVSLSQSDIIKSLVSALSWGNIEVAEWVDETFHVM
ncbi:hypothetical protein Pelo_4732 [Pelomyxa schiedti]|nr:hypothetical protein Pelo_4732 [Pelomyxa schiedti]